MKTVLHLAAGLALLCLSVTSHAQYSETFTFTNVGSIPSGWTTASNTDVAAYQRPGTCSAGDKGLQTPGVGKGAPTGFVLPNASYSTNFNDIVIKFSVFVYDANLKCGSSKPFPCATFVRAYLVPTTWSDPLGTPAAGQYYAAQPDYQILYPNTSNTIIFSNLSLPAGVTSYRVLLNFKTADNGNCSSSGTKFVFDDFGITSANCNNCAPTANSDYFNADVQSLFAGGTSFNGNVYGGYAMWATQAPGGFNTSSLTNAPAVNNGTDFDLNNTGLSNAKFALVPSSLAVVSSIGCTSTPSPGTLTFNSDGTFTYAKGSACVTRVSFSYTLTTYAGANFTLPYGTTAATKVIIDLPGQIIGLPVHFKSFSATRAEKKVVLKWETATEQNNKGFYVQRNTGSGWQQIGLVFSQTEDGNSTIERSYSFTDLNPAKDITQYRLLQVDFDGRGRYSETRAVRGTTSGGKVTLFPNPSATGNVSLLFDATGPKTVTVTDAAGNLVKQYRNVTASSLELKELGSGFYTVAVQEGATGMITVEKLIVKKR